MELGKIYKKTNETSYTLGASLTYELLDRKGEMAEHIYFHPDFQSSEMYDTFVEMCRERHIRYSINEKIFRRLSDKEKCLVIGEFRKYENEIDLTKNHLVLHNISNMGNLGTILRTAIGFHMEDIVLIRPSCDIFDPKVIRATMGALFQIRFRYYDSFEEYRKEAGEREYYCFRLNGSEDLRKVKKVSHYSLVFGNESSGLPKEFDQIGKGVLIHTAKTIDSLSLPVAVSIGLYEFTRGE